MAKLNEYLTAAELALENSYSLYAEHGWVVQRSENTFTVSTKPTHTGVDALKVEYFFPKNPIASARYLFENYVRLTGAQEDLFEFYHEVEKLSPDAFTGHFRIKGQAIVSAREFPIFICFLQLSDNTAALVSVSVDVPQITFGADSVQASIDFGMYLFEPASGNPENTHFIHVSRVDPKGSVPAVLVNTRLTSRGEQLKSTLDSVIAGLN